MTLNIRTIADGCGSRNLWANFWSRRGDRFGTRGRPGKVRRSLAGRWIGFAVVYGGRPLGVQRNVSLHGGRKVKCNLSLGGWNLLVVRTVEEFATNANLHREVTTMARYIGVVHKDANSEFSVSFPDFPDAVTTGATLAEAEDRARETLHVFVAGLIADGKRLPKPSSLEAVKADADSRDAVAFVAIADAKALLD
jgi:predicted RNase H-like HicB family nuclease